MFLLHIFPKPKYDTMASMQQKIESALAAAFISNCGARNFHLHALEGLEKGEHEDRFLWRDENGKTCEGAYVYLGGRIGSDSHLGDIYKKSVPCKELVPLVVDILLNKF
ncbi:hypothetical protein QYF36_027131 [Acer negundo]|nr:hypothetical protein QYF36_027131 [Acer negundo]